MLKETLEKIELRHLIGIIRYGNGSAVKIQNINGLLDKLITYYECKPIDKLSDTKKAQAILLLIGDGEDYGD